MCRRRLVILSVILALWSVRANAEMATLICPYGGRFGGGWTIVMDLSKSMIRTAHLNDTLIYSNVPFITDDGAIRWTSFSTDGKTFHEALTRDTLELTTTNNNGYYFSMRCILHKRQL